MRCVWLQAGPLSVPCCWLETHPGSDFRGLLLQLSGKPLNLFSVDINFKYLYGVQIFSAPADNKPLQHQVLINTAILVVGASLGIFYGINTSICTMINVYYSSQWITPRWSKSSTTCYSPLSVIKRQRLLPPTFRKSCDSHAYLKIKACILTARKAHCWLIVIY